MLDPPLPDLGEGLADVRGAVGVAVLERAPHHRADDAVLIDLPGDDVVGLDGAPIPDHRDGVRDGRDLVQLVGDHQARDAARLQPSHEVEQVSRIIFVERRGRLVEDEDTDVLRQRLGDFNQLLLANAEGLRLRVRADVHPDAGKQFDCLRPGSFPVDQRALHHLGAEEDVLGDGQLGDQRQLLMDDHDAPLL